MACPQTALTSSYLAMYILFEGGHPYKHKHKHKQVVNGNTLLHSPDNSLLSQQLHHDLLGTEDCFILQLHLLHHITTYTNIGVRLFMWVQSFLKPTQSVDRRDSLLHWMEYIGGITSRTCNHCTSHLSDIWLTSMELASLELASDPHTSRSTAFTRCSKNSIPHSQSQQQSRYVSVVALERKVAQRSDPNPNNRTKKKWPGAMT